MKVITQRELQAFADTMTNIINQCERLKARARAQGKNAVPAAEYWEMHDRFEKAAGKLLGEKRRFWETRESFFTRVMKVMASPEQVITTMARNGIRLGV